MEASFFTELKNELINGYAKKRHPFRYFTLATVHNGRPRQRTVVLRKMLFEDLSLLIFIDSRSQKVSDIAENPEVSALFYHPKKLLQIRVEGEAKLMTDPKAIEGYWKNMQENAKRDYTTKQAPGSLLSNPDHVEYLNEQPNFCVLQIVPHAIELLQLKRPNHLRIQYTKVNDDWKDQFLVP